jgi:SAM-dependent methyltransferase
LDVRPLFRPDVVRARMGGFELPPEAVAAKQQLLLWAQFLGSAEADTRTEESILPEFLNDMFGILLGYRGPVSEADGYTMSREQHVQVDGTFADAVLGRYGGDASAHVIAVEGKGPRDPLDRPFGGRRLSAVEQAYRYATNLPCDWVIVTNLREVRLYHKGSDQRTFERFDINAMAFDERQLRRFVFLLGAARVVSAEDCHLDALRDASERADAELTKAFYQDYAQLRREVLHALLAANPAMAPADVLNATQRLLDRVLFIAFCEDRGLLPAESLKRAWEHHDPYNPRPVWDNFCGLFRAIERGSVPLAIPAYNGGLFATDGLLDDMQVPDHACELLKRLGDYDFRSPDQVAILADEGQGPPVDVEILGHIFEQSISDLEELGGDLEAGRQVDRRLSSRHRQGAYYTPSFVTRHIVEDTVGRVVSARFEALRKQHQSTAKGTARAALARPDAYDMQSLNEPQRRALIGFWTAWLDELATIRVLDPACGSGAFLIEAFDQLYARYAAAIDHLDELRGNRGLYDPDRSILQHNLFGVDLSAEAVEICRLSIWIKTAQQGKALTDLDTTILVGNSVVDDPAAHPMALNWGSAFPEVMAEGGFDVVVGNPPYVRQELLGDIKPHLEATYAAYHGMADLYVYFFERGLLLLRPGGLLSFVVTNKWLKAGYAGPLRELLAGESWVRSVVDLGHAKQIFPDADVFPSIFRVQRPGGGEAPTDSTICVLPRDEVRVDDLGEQIQGNGFTILRSQLGGSPWELEPPEVTQLMETLRERGVPLAEYCGSKPYRGVLTGCNDAFLVDQGIRDRLVAEDPAAAEILKPYLRGQDVERWHANWRGLWLIAIKSSRDHHWPWTEASDESSARGVFASTYSSLDCHLSPFADRLKRRQDKGRFWWELRSCSYYEALEGAKVVYSDIAWTPSFSLDQDGMFANNTVYFLQNGDPWITSILNSPLLWWYSWRNAIHGKDEALRLFSTYVESIPIPVPNEEARSLSNEIVELLSEHSKTRMEAAASLADWLTVEHELAKIPKGLQSPFDLTEEAWVAAIRKARGRKRPLSSAGLRTVRDEYSATIAPLRERQGEVGRLERRLADLVFQAYGLDADQIALVWRTAPPRMPVQPPLPS